MSIQRYSEYQIKQKIVSIIRSFTNTYPSDTDIRINELQRNAQGDYIIKGQYMYKNVLTSVVLEKGTFDITLSAQNLDILASKITRA